MTELVTLARPYAFAAFKRAKEKKSSASWSESLAFLSVVVSDKTLAALINNPKVKKSKLSDLLLDLCKGNIDKEVENFLRLLLQNNRLALLPDIAKQFEALKAEDEGYITVEAIAAYPFDKEGEKKFVAALEKKLNKKVHLKVAVDKTLIGGVLVRAGDRVIDGSIKGQLESLRKTLQ